MIDLVFDVSLAQGDFTLRFAIVARRGAGSLRAVRSRQDDAPRNHRGTAHAVEGEIRVGDTTLFDSARGINLPPRDRHIGYVPQDVLLFPHLDVRSNLLYGSRAPSLDGLTEILESARCSTGVSTFSGGERQRVASDAP